ncbi:MAG: hypothetical protein CMM26_11675 [Rhodospirillaceae bacterium]|nr:hypothetical protein [Rhodospirillaceae bacterium]
MTGNFSSCRRRIPDTSLFAYSGLAAISVAAVALSLPKLSVHFADDPNIELLVRRLKPKDSQPS